MEDSSNRNLPDALQEVNDGIRWKHNNIVARFLDPETRDRQFARILDVSSEVEFAEYEVMDVRLARDQKSALVLVKFSWYAPGDLILVSGLETQEWRKVSDAWYMVAQRPPIDAETQRSLFVAEETSPVIPEKGTAFPQF